MSPKTYCLLDDIPTCACLACLQSSGLGSNSRLQDVFCNFVSLAARLIATGGGVGGGVGGGAVTVP